MCWHLGKSSKHPISIEHDPKSSPIPTSPTELTTKARASMSLGKSRILRSSSVGLVVTNCRASWRSWLSWTQWQSSKVWEEVGRQIIIERKSERAQFLVVRSNLHLSGYTLPLDLSECSFGTVDLIVCEQKFVVLTPNFGPLFQLKSWLIEIML